ncbi:MAG: Inositol 2-dehydrogenase/D-chiro-inositol 3-dehydrogenase [Candidatus Hydrogenedentes bacterium ADurb.Bin170]|nr:MAG: Inositol 2-dehydrogenase/D-chiro-inositol 3-dehydrogenase [Candidatus Hydrogenedentes bacterium ADurb.Bin170]
MPNLLNRRSFIQQSSVIVSGALLSTAKAAPSERIRLGLIGTANRGGQLFDAVAPHSDAEITAFCDVHGSALQKWREAYPDAIFESDYRRLLDRDDIDAVIVATPDHWHALQTIHACQAGKDVYCEKPLSLKLHEGRLMLDTARQHNRVVQVGLQRRASTMYQQLAEDLHNGLIGKITSAHCYRVTNMTPNGIGKMAPSDPPADLDWDAWLGPRPMRPYQANIAPYKFRWWKEYSSQVANWGLHFIDVLRWLMNEEAPRAVMALGGHYAVDDDRTIPDTSVITYEMPGGALIVYEEYEANGTRPFPITSDIMIRGTKGTLFASDRAYEIVPEKGGQFQDNEARMEGIKKKAEDGSHPAALMRNFLDCIKSRQRPIMDIEEGHRSSIFAHLANIALETRSMIEWDSAAERITNCPQANDLLMYEYRAPWTLG